FQTSLSVCEHHHDLRLKAPEVLHDLDGTLDKGMGLVSLNAGLPKGGTTVSHFSELSPPASSHDSAAQAIPLVSGDVLHTSKAANRTLGTVIGQDNSGVQVDRHTVAAVGISQAHSSPELSRTSNSLTLFRGPQVVASRKALLESRTIGVSGGGQHKTAHYTTTIPDSPATNGAVKL